MSDDQSASAPTLKYNTLASLESYLSVIKSLKKDDLDEEYYELMSSAKQLFGELGPQMAPFYYQYGNYLLEKIEKNGEVFGTFKPTKQQRQEKIAEANESDEESREVNPEEQNAQDELQQQKPSTVQASNISYQDGDVQITDDNVSPARATKNGSNNPNDFTGEKEEEPLQETADKEEEEEDEEEICYQNLEVSLSILMTEQSKYLSGELQLSDDEVNRLLQNLARVKGRLGDFYSIKQNFTQALTEYDEAIQYRKKMHCTEPDRMIASLELAMGNAYLFQGTEGAEVNALSHLIAAVRILTDMLKLKTLLDGYPLPSKEKATVDRLMYLPRWDDNEDVKELKQLISELLDKIEDTQIQMSEFAELQRIREQQKKQAELQAQAQSGFKQAPKDVKIVSLGTFGNANSLIRRKTPEPTAVKQSDPGNSEHQPKRQE